jgi:hypothetical protein
MLDLVALVARCYRDVYLEERKRRAKGARNTNVRSEESVSQIMSQGIKRSNTADKKTEPGGTFGKVYYITTMWFCLKCTNSKKYIYSEGLAYKCQWTSKQKN